jgi:hypothetical protein
MENGRRAEIIHEQVLILAEAYGLPISEARQQIYVEALMDLDPAKVKAGVGYIIKTRTFAGNLPTVAEIREAVQNSGKPMESRAAIAWDKALYALHHIGTYESVAFDDPIIHHIIVQWGGWTEFGDWNADQTHWKRKDFIALYEAYARSGTLPDPNQHLIGLTEYENAKRGFLEKVPQPYRITGNAPGAFIATRQDKPVQITHGPRRLEAVTRLEQDKQEGEGGAQALQG